AAAMSLIQTQPGGQVPSDLEPEIRTLRQRFSTLPMLATELAPIIDRLSSRGAALNLSRWVRGIARTAERVGLVVCGDLPLAVKARAEDGASPSVVNDLIDFSLSDELAMVRQALGLTVAV